MPAISPTGRGEADKLIYLIRQRAGTRESPHLFVSRWFYEAYRDLDSQPPPRIVHVEACRPREVQRQL